MRCQCGRQIFPADISVPIVCNRCNGNAQSVAVPQTADSPPRPIPSIRWPLWATLVKFCRYEADAGVGDTIKHMADVIGGERFKAWATQCGIPCGCTERQEKYNVQYPYDTPANPKISGAIAVTSVSPLERHRESQQQALSTWGRFGFDVVAVNTSQEIKKLTSEYKQVNEWIANDDEAVWADRKSQKIKSLFDVAIAKNTTIFVVNSDIEMHGSQAPVIANMPSKNVTLGIRWNYDEDRSAATEFQWGFDVIAATPEHANRLPKDFPFGIGQPVWDYAAPMLMSERVNILHSKTFYHKNHPLNWSDAAWSEGAALFEQYFGAQLTSENTPTHRRKFQPDWCYSHEQGHYVKCKSIAYRPVLRD